MFDLLAMSVINLPEFDPVAIEIGPVAIRWYSLGYITGLAFVWWYVRKLATRPQAAMTAQHIDDFITWAMLAIIIGGRLGYVLFYRPDYYLENPGDIIRIWDGGMAFHGGLLGVILTVIWYVRRNKLDLMRVADVLALVSPFGIGLVRITNFVNGELWGRATDVPWAMVFPKDVSGLPRHPSQLYEAFAEGLILFLLLQFLYHKTRLAKDAPGVIAGVFFAGYALARFLIEFVREPDAPILLSLTRGQLLTVPMFLFAAWLINNGIKARRAKLAKA